MRFKPGVVTYRWEQPLVRALEIADVASWAILGREAMVTSGRDGSHSADSLHYFRHNRTSAGAFDLRTWRGWSNPVQLPANIKAAYANRIRTLLAAEFPGEFDVVVEASHIHVEHDPKPRTETA